MYYTLYCNEQMLLDNWQEYDECNRLLKMTVQKTGLSFEEQAAMFYEKMRGQDDFAYYNGEILKRFQRANRRVFKLRQVNEVLLYEQDMEYIRNAIRRYELDELHAQLLFGAIFLCRLFDDETLKLDTEYKMRRFAACLGGLNKNLYMVRRDGVTWEDSYCT